MCDFNSNNVFWSDLASAHCVETVLDYLIENSINHLVKDDNSVNFPECRHVEDFSLIFRAKLYTNNSIAKDIPNLKKKITKCLKEIEPSPIQSLISAVVKRIDLVFDLQF